MNIRNSTTKHAGFTLIEVMVSVSIFAIVLTVGIGSLLTINNAYRKSQTERAALDNLNFVMESMAREIRVGSQYMCGSGCSPAGDTSLRFTDPDGQTIEYSFDSGLGRIVKSTDIDVLGMTDPSFIVIDDLRFFVVGEDPIESPALQPYVVITVTGTTVASNQTSTFTLQTSVSQRLLDRPLTP